ncbi:DUF3622 domain-containing protein [Psychromonas sp. CD1]|uniref:DUF3622 domain-containing protein n=1 Tax=Psychromonas sp. CD1 TaxID=1979839 RepID=UPI000B9C3BB1|nr:DUF3622 domain-containing protein [Psychromonas sp. CD1]
MAQNNKFEFQVKQDGENWNASIIRRVTARRTSISKQKKGFASEALATEWAEKTLTQFLESLQEGNKRKAEKRTLRNELAEKAQAEKEAAALAYLEKRKAHLATLDAAEETEETDTE